MKSGKLAVFAVLGLVALGYAIFELAGDRDDGVHSRDAMAQGQPDGEAKAARRQGRRAGAGRDQVPAGETKNKNVVVPVDAPPPPPPPPPMPLDQARKQYQDYIAELEAVKAEGRILSNDEWTEYYRRGNEVMDPLVRALDSSKADQAKEVNDSHTKFRELIMGLEPSSAAAAAGGAPGSAPQ